jgi:hypothetical protein
MSNDRFRTIIDPATGRVQTIRLRSEDDDDHVESPEPHAAPRVPRSPRSVSPEESLSDFAKLRAEVLAEVRQILREHFSVGSPAAKPKNADVLPFPPVGAFAPTQAASEPAPQFAAAPAPAPFTSTGATHSDAPTRMPVDGFANKVTSPEQFGFGSTVMTPFASTPTISASQSWLDAGAFGPAFPGQPPQASEWSEPVEFGPSTDSVPPEAEPVPVLEPAQPGSEALHEDMSGQPSELQDTVASHGEDAPSVESEPQSTSEASAPEATP